LLQTKEQLTGSAIVVDDEVEDEDVSVSVVDVCVTVVYVFVGG
jgi:hypothetical protein